MNRFLWDDAGFESESKPTGKGRARSAKGSAASKSIAKESSKIVASDPELPLLAQDLLTAGEVPNPMPVMEESIDPGTSPDLPLTVAQLNEWVTAAINANIPKVWVAGEISDISMPRSGHIYLALKDETSQIRAVVWRSTAERLKFRLEDGQAVVCFGRVDVYAPRGTYQIVIDRIEPQGVGALQIAFQQLYERLSKEGLFDADKKRPLPRFPLRVGFVTSPSGAAIRDFLEVLRRRWPGVNVLVIPTKVQGEGAAEEIARGIEIAQRIHPPLDTLVVGRGGGSTEDLWCFNDEKVVRAIARCTIPTVSAVGHEIDVTLSDLAADVRALTPSEAAELVVPSVTDIQNELSSQFLRAYQSLMGRMHLYRSRLDSLSHRPVLARPEELIQYRIQRVDELQIRLEQGVSRILSDSKHRMNQYAAAVEALSPLRTLSRGYSVSRNLRTGEIVSSAGQIQVGDPVENQLSQGKFRAVVTHLE